MTRAALVVAGLVALAGPAAAQTYDAANGFSITNGNPNGLWTYGFAASTTGAGVAVSTSGMTASAGGPGNVIEYWAESGYLPAVYHNTNTTSSVTIGATTWKPNGIVMHPYSGGVEYAVIRFTAPAAGTYSLAVTAESATAETATTDVHVLVNGVDPYAAITLNYGSNPVASGSITDPNLLLTAGSTVDLFVGSGNGSYTSDSTGVTFALVFTPVPEPAAVLAVAAVGLVALRRGRSWLLAILGGVALAGPAAAQTVVQYQFLRSGPGGSAGIGSLAPTSASSNVSASDVNFTGSVAQQGAFGADLLAVVPNSTSTTATLAVANNSYFQFTVTPNAGQGMNLTSLTFNAVFGDLPPAGFVLRSSADGFTTNIDSQFVTANDYQNPAFYTEDLTAAAYQNLTDPVTFRVYSFGLRPDRTAMFYDNLTLNGTFTPVPEPVALLAVAAVGLFAVRRWLQPIGR